MKTMYVTSSYGEIKEVEIEWESPHFVRIKGRTTKDAKRANYYNYFDSREDAKEFLISKQQEIIDRLVNRLNDAKIKQNEIRSGCRVEKTKVMGAIRPLRNLSLVD